MKILRTLTVAEVVGEFLRNEFHESDYNRDRDRYEDMVLKPDYSNAHENAVRQALLIRRRGPMWRELPHDIQWVQVQLEVADTPLIHVFPRAQWRKISNGSYCIEDIVKRIRDRNYRDGGGHVIAKIQQMRYRMQAGEYLRSTVILIGLDAERPMTIFEGNHRLCAAMLVGPHAVTKFDVVCGFSPRMIECCYYRSNFPNVWRYLWRRLGKALYDPEADIARLGKDVPQPAMARKTSLDPSKLTGPQSRSSS